MVCSSDLRLKRLDNNDSEILNILFPQWLFDIIKRFFLLLYHNITPLNSVVFKVNVNWSSFLHTTFYNSIQSEASFLSSCFKTQTVKKEKKIQHHLTPPRSFLRLFVFSYGRPAPFHGYSFWMVTFSLYPSTVSAQLSRL